MELSPFRNFRMALGMADAGEEPMRPAATDPGATPADSEPKPRTDSASSSGSSHRSHGSRSSSGHRRKHTRQHHHPNGENGGELNLPLHKEFVPLHDHKGDETAAMEDEATEDAREDVICAIFDLPRSTTFYKDFSCAIAAAFPMHGRMYPTSTHACFYSNVFGRERKILIPYESITELSKTTTLVFQAAIRIKTSTGEDFTFSSFWGTNRDDCFELISQIRTRVVGGNAEASVDSTGGLTGAANTDDDDREQRLRRSVSDGGIVAVPRDTTMELLVEEKMTISVDAFLATFILDDAPFGLVEYNARIGTTEMQCNPWSPLSEDALLGRTRSLQFRVPIDSPIGPNSSMVDVLQCLKTGERGLHTIETSTRLVDIPYGDYFSVEDRWTIAPHPRNPDACSLTIELKVIFSKSTIWKGKIESRAIADNKTKWLEWLEMAKAHLAENGAATNGTTQAASTFRASTTHRPTATVPRVPIVETDGTQLHSTSSSPRRRTLPKRIAPHDLVVEPRDADTVRDRSQAASVSPKRRRRTSSQGLPWLVLVVILLCVIVRLHSTLTRMEQALLTTEQRVIDIQEQVTRMRTELSVCR